MGRPAWFDDQIQARRVRERFLKLKEQPRKKDSASVETAANSPLTAPTKTKKINGHAHFLFEWQRAFSAVEDTSSETGLPSTTRLVLWTVSRFMDADGTGAYPGQERIAKAAGLTLRATKDHLERAIDRGWLKRSRNHKSRYGVGYTYTATLPPERDTTVPGIAVSGIRKSAKGDT